MQCMQSFTAVHFLESPTGEKNGGPQRSNLATRC